MGRARPEVAGTELGSLDAVGGRGAGAPLRLPGGSPELQHRETGSEYAGALPPITLSIKTQPSLHPLFDHAFFTECIPISSRFGTNLQFGMYRQYIERNAFAASPVEDFGDLSYLLRGTYEALLAAAVRRSRAFDGRRHSFESFRALRLKAEPEARGRLVRRCCAANNNGRGILLSTLFRSVG